MVAASAICGRIAKPGRDLRTGECARVVFGTRTVEDPKRILDLAGELKQLARSAATDASVDDLVRRGLDWLARLAPYDLATFFVLEDNRLVARIRRGVLADGVPEGYSLPLERFPTIRAAIDTRRARAFTEEEHAHGDGDPVRRCARPAARTFVHGGAALRR